MFFKSRPRKRALEGHVDALVNGRLAGWAADLKSTKCHVHVALYINGVLVARKLAHRRRDDLLTIGLSANHGFVFDLLPLSGRHVGEIEMLAEIDGTALRLSMTDELRQATLEFLRGEFSRGSEASCYTDGDELHPLDEELHQFFRPGKMRWTGASFRLFVPRIAASKRIEFSVRKIAGMSCVVSDEAAGEVVCRQQIEVSAVDDSGSLHLYFDPIDCDKDDLFSISLKAIDGGTAEPPCVWLSSRPDHRIPGHVRCIRERDLGRFTGLFAKVLGERPFDTALPELLLYSPLSSCNMNCIHCISRHSRDRVHRLPDRIKGELRSHVDNGHLKGIFTDYSGDILFADAKNPGELDFLFSLGIPIHVDTNGAYLTDEVIERLVCSPVNEVGISVDAATHETYKRVRVGSPPIDQIFASVRSLVDARARHRREHDMSIHMSFVLMRSNITELKLFIDKAAAAGADAVAGRHLEIYHPKMKEESLYLDKALFNEIRIECLDHARRLGIILDIGAKLDHNTRPKSIKPCEIPWSSAVVLANGDVMAYCVPGSKMGNLATESLESIWRGHAYRRLRAEVNSKCPPSLCRTCHFRRDLNGFTSLEDLYAGLEARPLLEELDA